MQLTVKDIAQMFDLSCVRTNNTEKEIMELVEAARNYHVRHVSVMQCYIPLVKKLLANDPEIKTIGNVSFPSGSDTTSIKVLQAREMVTAGCDEIDVVMNVGKLLSGHDSEVEADIKAVVEAASPLPVKVIIETPYLERNDFRRACEISMRAEAAFVKTGTGWAPRGTTMEDVALIKSIVGDRIKIKASGGIRDLKTLAEMHKIGVTRFGVNLISGKKILDECIMNGGSITF